MTKEKLQSFKIGDTQKKATVRGAGKKGESGSADGPGDVARFNSPTGIVADASGTLYVSDSFNNAIRTIRCR